MNSKAQIVFAWCGIFIVPVLMIALSPDAGFFPPHLNDSSASAAEIASLYQQHTDGIRWGSILILICGGFYIGLVAVISAQMRVIENAKPPVLTYAQLVSGLFVAIVFIVPAMCWTTAAFRPERNPEITQLVNDFAWIFLLMPFAPAFVQNLSIGLAIHSDRSPRPVFPRWMAYMNYWVCLTLLPGVLITFFKTGPLAANGMLAATLPIFSYIPWQIATSVYLIKGAKRLDRATAN